MATGLLNSVLGRRANHCYARIRFTITLNSAGDIDGGKRSIIQMRPAVKFSMGLQGDIHFPPIA